MPATIGDASEYIHIRVYVDDDNYFLFEMKRRTSLKKLMDRYCERVCRRRGTIGFTYHGIEIYGVNSPLSLELEDGAIIKTFKK